MGKWFSILHLTLINPGEKAGDQEPPKIDGMIEKLDVFPGRVRRLCVAGSRDVFCGAGHDGDINGGRL